MCDVRTPTIPVSWGELLDKLTILGIKRERLADEAALENVEREFRLLRAIAQAAWNNAGIGALTEDLRRVNEQLWDVEDAIRQHDAAGSFGAEFVALAQSVYRKNDQRSSLKRRINALLDSALVEEKSYPAFAAAASDAEIAIVACSKA